MLKMFFPLTGLFFDPLLIFATGLLGGFVSGFFGIGCGVVITPVLMEFGIPPLWAVATQLCHAVGTNFTNFLTYKRNRDVDFHLAAYILFGGFLGAACEFILINASRDSELALNKFIYVYIIILIIFGFVMIIQSIKDWRKKDQKKHFSGVVMRRWMLYLPFHKIFVRSRAEMSVLIPIFVGFLAGLLVASLGGGNNLFMAPIIIYLIGRISPVVNGTTALAGCVITGVVAMIYSSADYCCDILFVLILFAGAAFGSWIGVKLTYNVKRYYINLIAGFIVFLMASRQIFKLLNNSFGNNQALVFNTSKSKIATLVSNNKLLYTFLCIILVIIIAFLYEKLFEFLSYWKTKNKEGKFKNEQK